MQMQSLRNVPSFLFFNPCACAPRENPPTLSLVFVFVILSLFCTDLWHTSQVSRLSNLVMCIPTVSMAVLPLLQSLSFFYQSNIFTWLRNSGCAHGWLETIQTNVSLNPDWDSTQEHGEFESGFGFDTDPMCRI
eukprot:TRINITY_DN40001_c0_g1_i1.p1 TRINITY_DN40001_c0_g1~~TRINITY_DN40001_c0_g1_i1.p1  ORF type:complete len:134 (-),score=12.07 TRINITY_DN40001_c0_g1_i1:48-449(-)